MANVGYINQAVRAMYGIPYSKLTAEQKKILHADSVRRANLIEEREKAVLQNNLKAFADEAKMEKVLASIYTQCQKDIIADVTETIASVKRAGGEWSYANQSALTRSRGLFDQITEEITKLGQKENIAFTQGLSNIYTDQFLRQVYTLGQSIPVKANFNRLNPALIKQTLNYPWSGAMFSDRLWQDKETLGRNLRAGLTQSMILGESIPQITDRINKGIDTSRYNAERVARSETKRVTYVAHDAVYEDTGVEELEYRCANGGDARTCSVCFADNGKKYKRGEEPTLPRHPNCRCVYIPVVSDTFGSNELNNLTGSVRGAENYNKWIEENGDKINPDGSLKDGWVRDWKSGGKLVKKKAEAQTVTIKTGAVTLQEVNKQVKDAPDQQQIKVTDYSEEFYATKAEAKNTQALMDYMNNKSNADPEVLALYRSMDALDDLHDHNISLVISHGAGHSLSRKYDGDGLRYKLTIPKVSVDDASSYVTSLHEEMHLLDALVSVRNGNDIGMYSRSCEALTKAFSSTKVTMGDKVANLFKEYNNECDNIVKLMQSEYDDLIAVVKRDYTNGKITYAEFGKSTKKVYNYITNKKDTLMRNAMGGGVDALQDIYDALSGGSFRDTRVVRYGHGGSYYARAEKRPSEALANYGSLSITHPELIELLAEDQPELANGLATCVSEMLMEVK